MIRKFTFIILSIMMSALTAHAFPSHDFDGSPQHIGETKEIVFIHGMYVNPEYWRGWIQYFTDRGYTVTAPAWPMHSVRGESADLGTLTLDQVIDSYRKFLQPKKAHPPILIGHSMGGLIAQIMLNEGLGSAAIALEPAPPRGVVTFMPAFLVGNWPAINPFVDMSHPVHLSPRQFRWYFTNAQTREVQEAAYRDAYMPESKHIGPGILTDVAKLHFFKRRGPLLLIAGSEDRIIPAGLVYNNFLRYKSTGNFTEFMKFEGRDHWITEGANWENVADYVATWIGWNH